MIQYFTAITISLLCHVLCMELLTNHHTGRSSYITSHANHRAESLHHTTLFSSFVQDHLVQAEYWHDPFNVKEYEQKCVFLPDINNIGSVRGDSQTMSVWMMVGLSELFCSLSSGEECHVQSKLDDD